MSRNENSPSKFKISDYNIKESNFDDIKIINRKSYLDDNSKEESDVSRYMYRMKLQIVSGPCGYIDSEFFYSHLYDTIDELKEKWKYDIPIVEKSRWERSRKIIIQKVKVTEQKLDDENLGSDLNKEIGSSFDEI